ncbi:hypothetical protein [Pseudomonas sp. PGPR81]|nr:hypothetical protein [Pseudomonas sp. PGPR81]
MNAPHRLAAIEQAKQRISDLEKEIKALQEDGLHEREQQFIQELTKLMKRSHMTAADVIELLVLRGDLDARWFAGETLYKMKHLFGMAEVFASHGVDRPSWLPKR